MRKFKLEPTGKRAIDEFMSMRLYEEPLVRHGYGGAEGGRDEISMGDRARKLFGL